MGEKWICSCGQENDDNFCIMCGAPRPAVTLKSQASPPVENTWVCVCGAVNSGSFCNQCGTPRSTASAEPQTAAPILQIQKKKPRKKMFIIIGASAAALVVASALLLYFFVFSKSYVVNKYTADGTPEIMEGYALLTDSERDISVLYPEYLEASVQDNGSYIYGNGTNAGCFIRITRAQGKESPEHYFKKFKAMLEEDYSDVTFSSINEVHVEDKTLYMIMADIPDLGFTQQYLELYPDYYVSYTSVGYENEDGVNTELYYAISTLKPDELAYAP